MSVDDTRIEQKLTELLEEQPDNEKLQTLQSLIKGKKNHLGLNFNEDELDPTDGAVKIRGRVPELERVDRLAINKGKGLTNNKLIESDNMYALTALVKEGKKFDVIYIDPPYNTGNDDLGYEDKRIGADDIFKDTKWLAFIKPRLELARKLLKSTGIILISIDDFEQAYLKVLMDEIFGKENFLNTIVWYYGKMSNESRKFANNHEYILAYSYTQEGYLKPSMKKEDSEYKNRWIKYVKDNKIFYGDVKQKLDHMLLNRIKHMRDSGIDIDDNTVLYDFDKEYKVDSDTIYSPILKGNADERVSDFGAGQKPQDLMKRLLSAVPTKNASVLDFFAGTGTTGQAVLQLNKEDGGHRTFTLVTSRENSAEEPEKNIAHDITYQRLSKVINGYTTPAGKQVEALAANLEYFKITDKTLIKKDELDSLRYDDARFSWKVNDFAVANGDFVMERIDPTTALLQKDAQTLVLVADDLLDEQAVSASLKKADSNGRIKSIEVYTTYPIEECGEIQSTLENLDIKAVVHLLGEAGYPRYLE